MGLISAEAQQLKIFNEQQTIFVKSFENLVSPLYMIVILVIYLSQALYVYPTNSMVGMSYLNVCREIR
jgi:hypothetical protein